MYAVKDSLAALHRRSPALRGLLTATSTGLRRAFGWQTTYEETELVGTIAVTCMIAHLILHQRSKNIQHDLDATQERVFNLLSIQTRPGNY